MPTLGPGRAGQRQPHRGADPAMALPIVSSCLVALGVAVPGKLADVTDNAVAKLIGKRASQVLEEVRSRVRAY
jgi:hypothetical protein